MGCYNDMEDEEEEGVKEQGACLKSLGLDSMKRCFHPLKNEIVICELHY